ncbi:MAG: hypothetical protein ACOC9Y_01810 [Chloroflexota bacterium]
MAILADRWSIWLALPVSMLVVWLVYGSAIRYSVLFDDAVILSQIANQSLIDLLLPTSDEVPYRPMPHAIWKASELILGAYDPVILHLLLLFCHAVAGWFFFTYLREFGAGYWATGPALLFLLFPFAYQNVFVVGALYVTLAVAAALASATLYAAAHRCGDTRRSRSLHMLALATTAVALGSHEIGSVVVALVAGVEVSRWLDRGWRSPSHWVLAHLFLTGAVTLLWLRQEGLLPDGTIEAGGLRLKALYVLQGLTYPVTAQFPWLDAQLGRAPGVLEGGGIALLLLIGVTCFAAIRGEETGSFKARSLILPGVAVVTAGLAGLVILLRLAWIDVEDSPQLLYPVGIAASILWGFLLRLRLRFRRVTMIWRALSGVLLGVLLAQSISLSHEQKELFDLASTAVEAVVQEGERHPGSGVLIVNMPSWIERDRPPFPLGRFGAQAVSPDARLDQVISAGSQWQPEVSAQSVRIEPLRSSDSLEFSVHGQHQDDDALDSLLREERFVIEVRFTGERFAAASIGRLAENRAASRAATAVLANERIGVTSPRVRETDDSVEIFLSWLVIDEIQREFEVATGLRSEDGELMLVEGRPLAGTAATSHWRAGDRVDDTVVLQLDESGIYEVVAGVRDRSTGRLLAPGYVPIRSVDVRLDGD